MGIFDLEEKDIKVQEKKQEMYKAVDHYREIIDNEESTREEIKEACNDAIRTMAEVISLQIEERNALVMAGQILGDAITNKPHRPKS